MPPAPVFVAPQQYLRSSAGLAKAVVVLLMAVAVADLLAMAAGLNIRRVLGNGPENDFATYDDAEATLADNLYGSAGALQGVMTLATGIVFILWFRRLRMNAEVFDPSVQPMSPGWSIGAWFVPFANLVLPRRIAGGIWTASAQTNPDGSWRTVPATAMNLWWGAWVCSLAFSWVTSRQYMRAEKTQEIIDAAGLVMASDALDIVAAVFAILFVRKLTRMQGERAALGVYPLGARG
ncbi:MULTISPECIES: DUF4328 domain-containing protein [unclassified Streptomyces]|uniref:DUF4328 domain-containing protein n=1 Tax=unclassified Streptomyces TaxID=2593676 RepID=UPI002259EB40|nr:MULTISPECIES: DUF4328 domain-containing protein [unclassified Streptomyces]WSP57049.1 DUF4328 domain-containing protein [Streptomyces sp. NBC_01241]WSU22233.1 DUF4328 domain-containing protein [Streptomyces sp. NBC_01108]MCX4795408.1 DUF4328 domain-containing protein [Streptomyces sp. NBC_01242]WSJ36706.1 DUF4328 domain-containing protein [Streptomyces sp. NBC_01321]WSP63123.1 DUF4328 domain-containing protein [Streptomyces sp. NBC_01240]